MFKLHQSRNLGNRTVLHQFVPCSACLVPTALQCCLSAGAEHAVLVDLHPSPCCKTERRMLLRLINPFLVSSRHQKNNCPSHSWKAFPYEYESHPSSTVLQC